MNDETKAKVSEVVASTQGVLEHLDRMDATRADLGAVLAQCMAACDRALEALENKPNDNTLPRE